MTLRPGGAAWFLVAKYRCDLGTIASDPGQLVTVSPVVTSPVSASSS